jgi:predicted nuclease of predicted toxin-antitoxin system
MKFFLDENFPKSATSLLHSLSHEVFDLRGSQLEGIDDASIFRYAQSINAVFLTTDRDFFHTIPHLFPEHCGIVVIALRAPNRVSILSKLEWFLNTVNLDQISNRVLQLRDKTWVMYPPLR